MNDQKFEPLEKVPNIEIAEWAEELGLDNPKDRRWIFYGDLAVEDKRPLKFACGCAFSFSNILLTSEENKTDLDLRPEEIYMQRLSESEYMVGQCSKCKTVLWVRAVVIDRGELNDCR